MTGYPPFQVGHTLEPLGQWGLEKAEMVLARHIHPAVIPLVADIKREYTPEIPTVRLSR